MGEKQVNAATLFQTQSYHFQKCWKCHIGYYLDDDLYTRAKSSAKTNFFCPNGHSAIFTETEEAKLKKQLEFKERQLLEEQKRTKWAREDAELARKQRARQERRAAAFKGVITKTKKRVGRGVCPCCNRFFQKLHDHMAVKHPEYKGKKK